jgi:hypothetical protein
MDTQAPRCHETKAKKLSSRGSKLVAIRLHGAATVSIGTRLDVDLISIRRRLAG